MITTWYGFKFLMPTRYGHIDATNISSDDCLGILHQTQAEIWGYV